MTVSPCVMVMAEGDGKDGGVVGGGVREKGRGGDRGGRGGGGEGESGGRVGDAGQDAPVKYILKMDTIWDEGKSLGRAKVQKEKRKKRNKKVRVEEVRQQKRSYEKTVALGGEAKGKEKP